MPVAGVVWLAGLAALEWVLSGGVILLLAENPGSSELEPTAAITTGLFTGVVITGLIISYGLGRFIAAPIIEMASGQKLTKGQKNGVGIATMIL